MQWGGGRSGPHETTTLAGARWRWHALCVRGKTCLSSFFSSSMRLAPVPAANWFSKDDVAQAFATIPQVQLKTKQCFSDDMFLRDWQQTW